ncbi:hypothetical protein [Algoriphagus sediminis]|uniref:Restriction endonuclease subunit S n=1 Tax=Algoriphagus sediminis TaxID=3057113 RepID=A0ABT7YGQ1_9BACT|nr:hypothetical protein [Algoriphagus sediminis]MDN3205648.1 hypothetical protein [Algoriphagus sediminis]
MIEEKLKEKMLQIDKSSWKLTTLGELATEISKRVDNPSQSQYDRFVGLEHFVSGDIKIKKWGATDNLASSAKAFQAGDILFARRNAYLRRASLVEFDGCCSGDAFVIREDREKVVPGFLAFLMNSNGLWDFANSNAAGTMSKRVKWRDLANYEFLLPPQDQQAKLAELLWAMDEVIEKEKDAQEALIVTRKALHKIDFANYRRSKYKIDDFVTKVGSGVTPKGGSKVYIDSGVMLIRSQNVLFGEFDFDDVAFISDEIDEKMKSSRVLKNDVLLNITGASIGRSSVYVSDRPSNVNQHVCIIRTADGLDPTFLCEFINSSYGQNQVQVMQAGGNREGLNFTSVRLMRIPEYSYEEQLELRSKYVKIIEGIFATRQHISESQSLQKSLINQIF